MNGVSLLIMLIVAISIASLGAYLYTGIISDAQDAIPPYEKPTDVDIIQVIATNISNNTAKHVRISVTTTGALRVDDGLITLRTPEDQATLRSRNGTLERNSTGGFYTE